MAWKTLFTPPLYLSQKSMIVLMNPKVKSIPAHLKDIKIPVDGVAILTDPSQEF